MEPTGNQFIGGSRFQKAVKVNHFDETISEMYNSLLCLLKITQNNFIND